MIARTMSDSWLDILPAGLAHNLEAIVIASEPESKALELARQDWDRAQLYFSLADEVLRHRSERARG